MVENEKKYNYIRKEEYLPVKLVQKINDDILGDKLSDYRTKNNFLRCVGIIYHYQIHGMYGLEGYVPLGSSYWKEVFCKDYYKRVIKPLLELNIVQSFDFGYRNTSRVSLKDVNEKSDMGQQKGLVGIRYRINPELTNSDCAIIRYIVKGINNTKKDLNNDFEEFKEVDSIPDKRFHVGIFKDRAFNWIEENIERTCMGLLNLNHVNLFSENKQIKYIEYLDNNTYNPRYGTIKYAKADAQRIGKKLFYYDDTFYIADIDKFLKDRIELMKYFYKREISKVGVYQLNYSRSRTNLRVHNYLTNFPSAILQYITINNRTIVQLDLKTSQFLLFANLLNVYILQGENGLLCLFKKKQNKIYLKKLIGILKQYQHQLPSVGVDINNPHLSEYSNHDVIKFIRDVFFNDFYIVVQTILGFRERRLAKDEVFKLLFKKDSKPDDELKKLNNHYKVVMAIISDFKRLEPIVSKTITKSKKNDLKANLSGLKTRKVIKQENDELSKQNELTSNFSVFLQCIEAEIFIDNILLPLRKQGVPCFTRHDSIVVAKGYENQVEAFIKKVFDDFGFRYNHKQEDKWWEVYSYQEIEDSGIWDLDSDEDIESLVMQDEICHMYSNMNKEFSKYNSVEYTSMDKTQSKTIEQKNNAITQNIVQSYECEEDEDEIEDREDKFEYLDDEEIYVLEKLDEIGIQEDYCEFIDNDFLEEILQLSILNEKQKECLQIEIYDSKYGMECLNEEVNEILRGLINYWNNYDKLIDV